MTFHCVFQPDGALFSPADAFQGAFGQIQVLQILQVFEDRFADIVGFCPPGAARQLLQALFDGLRKPNSQHSTSLYKYSIFGARRGTKYAAHGASDNELIIRRGLEPREPSRAPLDRSCLVSHTMSVYSDFCASGAPRVFFFRGI